MTEQAGAEKPMHVVVRALSVLSALGQERQGLTLQQLHHRLDIPLGSMHRLLATLEHERFVTRSINTKRYTLGASAQDLAPHSGQDLALVQPPAAVVDAAKRSTETVFLTQMIDSRVICVSLVESVHHLRLFVRVGQEMPLHAAASARVILAYRDPALVEALLTAYPRQAFTPGTVREVNQLIDHLAEVRRYGLDVCSSELDDNVWAVAAPIFTASGRVESGVTLAAAVVRMQEPERRAQATRIVLEAAAELSRAQGYTGPLNEIETVEELTARYAVAEREHPFVTLDGTKASRGRP